MSSAILPSGPGALPPRWSTDHLRLHRSLLHQPELLPAGSSLLLAVSGGQDSMAMTGLLQDLQPLHHWRLQLWHGDHGWRAESARQARELEAWAQARQLPIRVERQAPVAVAGNREAQARRWRYACLQQEAVRLGCSHVLTAHTASDRAETVLLHLARGSHRRGLVSLRRRLPLADLLDGSTGLAGTAGPVAGVADALWLVRPLQLFRREDTARLCRREGWPVWLDPSNQERQLRRNRIRAEVLPVLEELHPGASCRISDQAERLAGEQDQHQELLDLALIPLQPEPFALDRQALLALSAANRALVLQHWLRRQWGRELDRRSLATLLPRLALERGPGRMDLTGGWQLRWRGTTLALLPPSALPHGHG